MLCCLSVFSGVILHSPSSIDLKNADRVLYVECSLQDSGPASVAQRFRRWLAVLLQIFFPRKNAIHPWRASPARLCSGLDWGR